MNKRPALLLLCVLSACVYSAMADTVITDGVYTISNRDRDGYLGLGAYHYADPYIYYVTNGDEPTEDAYWTVTSTPNGYTFQNKATGQWLVYTTERDDLYYKWMTLADNSPDNDSYYWNIVDAGDGSVCVQSQAAKEYYWNLRDGAGLLGTYTPFSYSWNECFVFHLADQNSQQGTDDPDTPDTPEAMTSFPEALHVFLKDGRVEAYPMEYVRGFTESGGQLFIKMTFDEEYIYPLADVERWGFEAPKDFPTFESFKFNNKFNDQLFTDALGEMVEDTVFVTIAAIGKRLTPSFKVPDDQTLVYLNGELQDSKVTRQRFDKDVYYVVTRPGITMLLPKTGSSGETTYSMQPYGRMVRVHVHWLTDRADVPRIDIYTDDGYAITSKTEYKDAEITIDGRGIFPSMDATAVQIKGRGNSSWGWPKKPYRLKFAKKVKPLGMKNGKNWVLLSNYQTGSLMANAIGMKAANLMGATAANHIVPVELYLNGEYQGSYNLTEKVGFSNNSVELTDESAAALLELDSYYDEPEGQKFHSQPYDLPINVKEPDFSDEEAETSLTLEMVENNFNRFMATLYYGQDISRHVDVEQLARFLMVNELICNFELYHPKSTFCYRENYLSQDSKYVFGPVWDLDWAFGYQRYHNYFRGDADTNYWINMPVNEVRDFICDLRFKTPALDNIYQTLWEEFMHDGLNELMEYCKDYYDFAHNSFDHNREVWNDNTDYAKQASAAADWLKVRANRIYDDLLNGIRPDIQMPELADFQNDKLYTITCQRGKLVLSEDATRLVVEQQRSQCYDEEEQFAIINIEGNYYLYSPANNQYLSYDGTFVSRLGTPIFFDASHGDGEYNFMLVTYDENDQALFFNHDSWKLDINSHDTPDEGNLWRIEAVKDFDPTEALDLGQENFFAINYEFLFDGKVVKTVTRKVSPGSALPPLDNSMVNDYISLIPVGELPETVQEPTNIAYRVVWKGPFLFSKTLSSAKWYNMTIRSDYYVGKQDSEPYYPYVASEDDLETPEFQWAFGGDPYNLVVYNRSTGFEETLTQVDDYGLMRQGDYYWDVLPNDGGFLLKIKGTTSSCLNQYGGEGGPLKFWTDYDSLTDNGSTFRVERVKEEDTPVNILANYTSKTTGDVRDIAGRMVKNMSKPGVYILNGKKVLVK